MRTKGWRRSCLNIGPPPASSNEAGGRVEREETLTSAEFLQCWDPFACVRSKSCRKRPHNLLRVVSESTFQSPVGCWGVLFEFMSQYLDSPSGHKAVRLGPCLLMPMTETCIMGVFHLSREDIWSHCWPNVNEQWSYWNTELLTMLTDELINTKTKAFWY